MGEMLKTYWKPVYCYLRCKGYDNEQAKDLTQGFFQRSSWVGGWFRGRSGQGAISLPLVDGPGPLSGQ